MFSIKKHHIQSASWSKLGALSLISAVMVIICSNLIIRRCECVPINRLDKMPWSQASSELLQDQIPENVQIRKEDALLTIQNISSSLKVGKRFKRYSLQGSYWPKQNLTYKILKYPTKLKKADVDAEISRAFSVWSENSSLNFTVKRNGSADIQLSFVSTENGDPFDGPRRILARAYFPDSGGCLYFDNSEDWTIKSLRGINLFQTAAHEIGHTLGLSHSKIKSAIMAPVYRAYDARYMLHEDDIKAIQRLYGSRRSPISKPRLLKFRKSQR